MIALVKNQREDERGQIELIRIDLDKTASSALIKADSVREVAVLYR
jgi:hypothetical protein